MKTYLGDSVFAMWDHGMLRLTTENGPSSTTNTIYLEPEVITALLAYLKTGVAA